MKDKRIAPEVVEAERYELAEGPAYLFPVSRREFLEFSGAGLVILVAQPLLGQRQGEPGKLEGRLHIGEDGKITVLSGKIEEGQGPRTELAMVAAEELHVPLGHIRMLLADTDSVPNDGITAGSRSTPSTVPVVRRAAAAARELLISTAAARWQIGRERVRVTDGSAIEDGGNRKLSYADLARLPELAKAYDQAVPSDVVITPAREWQVLGRPAGRIDGRDIVTGAHKYPSDIERPGMLYGSVLRAPSYGAKLTSVDVAEASKMSGVTVVRDDEFVGCAAPTSYLARKAVAAIAKTAQWQQKEQPSSDQLFEYFKQHPEAGGRIREEKTGDVERALAGAKTRLKATYQTAYIQHAPMEPRAAVAEWQDGKLTVWTGTSNPFGVRDQLTQAFQLTPQRVRVIVPDMGGGFGGKHTGECAIEAARLAREAKRPVSLRWTRPEEFTWAYFRPAALIEIDAALDDRKSIAAWDFVNYNSGTSALDTPYRLGNKATRYVPCDSPLRQGSYRALASTANNFARESFMDELAAAAGADPLGFRMAHLENPRIREVLEAATRRFRWKERQAERKPNRGVGLACGTEKNSVVAACVEVEVDPAAGTVRLLEICEAFECGAVLNPLNLQAQVEGCILMGLGAALREEILFGQGRLKNGRFAGYRVTRFRDIPKIDVVLVDKKDSEPVGAGETPIIAVAPAMGNAVFAATGQRIRSLPLRLNPART